MYGLTEMSVWQSMVKWVSGVNQRDQKGRFNVSSHLRKVVGIRIIINALKLNYEVNKSICDCYLRQASSVNTYNAGLKAWDLATYCTMQVEMLP